MPEMNTERLAAIIHDIKKYSDEYQEITPSQILELTRKVGTLKVFVESLRKTFTKE